MKNNKKILIIGISTVIIAIIITIIVSIFQSVIKDRGSRDDIDIYYYNATNKVLSPEKTSIDLDSKSIIEDIYNKIGSIPKTTGYISVIKNNIRLLGYYKEDDYLYISFSDDYNSLSSIEQMIFRAGLVWSITQMPNISKVKIYIEDKEIIDARGEPIGFLSQENIRIAPKISPDKTKEQKITLYFTNENMDRLIEKEEIIKIKQNQDKALQIVEYLIKGPVDNRNISAVPSETKIRNVKTEDGICYVDLSADFMLKRENIPHNIAVYSIVNSLTKLKDIDRVQILIEGEKIDLYGDIDISKPLKRNENIIN